MLFLIKYFSAILLLSYLYNVVIFAIATLLLGTLRLQDDVLTLLQQLPYVLFCHILIL